MFKLTLKNIWAHKMRLVLSMVSIFLGVAFLSGTLVFTSTIRTSFNDLFTSAFKSTDAIVAAKGTDQSTLGQGRTIVNIDRTLLDEINKIPGVREAQGDIRNDASKPVTVIDSKGKRIFPLQGPPVFATGLPKSAILTPWILVDNKGENFSAQKTIEKQLGDNEVIIDKASADTQNLKIGSKIKIVTSTDVREYKVSGFMRFGTADGFGGSAWLFFNDKQAGDIVEQVDSYGSISVAAKQGVTQKELSNSIQKQLDKDHPGKYEVNTGDQMVKDSQKPFKTFFDFFTIFLLVFAGISFLVAFIIIVNSFAIIMTQRKREYALLRAIGATGAQIRRSVLGESLVVGIVASLFGVLGGIGLATAIRAIFKAAGAGIPAGKLVIPNSSIYIGIIIGTLATFISAFFPAWHASRVPPIEALRDSAFEKNRKMLYRFIFSSLILIISIILIFIGYNKAKTDSGDGLQVIGIGIVFLLLYVVVALPMFIKPITKIVGSRVAGVLLVVFGGRRAFGVTGEIARRNNYRNPRRSAKTSLALMIGVALVVFITVFASSATATFDNYLKQTYSADLIVGSFGGGGGTQLSQKRCDDIDAQNFITASSCVRVNVIQFAENGTDKSLSYEALLGAKTKDLDKLFTLEYTGRVNNINKDEILVTKDLAKKSNLKVGKNVTIIGAIEKRQFKVAGILDQSILGDGNTFIVDMKALDQIVPTVPSNLSFVLLKDNVKTSEAKDKLDILFKDTGIEVNDLKSIRDQQQKSLNNILGIVYGLLALAIIIAAIGILNTMSLSILERRRELGLMRAVGTSKSQVRGFIRFESVILSVLGTAVGMCFGLGSGYLLIKSLKSIGFTSFSINPVSMIVIVFLSALIGVIAGAWPAWRATKVDMLKAVTTE